MIGFKDKALVSERYIENAEDVMRFNLMLEGEDYAFICIKNGKVLSANYYGSSIKQDKPNFDTVIEILYLFSIHDKKQFCTITKLLNNSEDHDLLIDSAKRFVGNSNLKYQYNFMPAV